MRKITSEIPKLEFNKEPIMPINWWPIYDTTTNKLHNDTHDIYLWKMISKNIVAKSPTYSLKTLMEKHDD